MVDCYSYKEGKVRPSEKKTTDGSAVGNAG